MIRACIFKISYSVGFKDIIFTRALTKILAVKFYLFLK